MAKIIVIGKIALLTTVLVAGGCSKSVNKIAGGKNLAGNGAAATDISVVKEPARQSKSDSLLPDHYFIFGPLKECDPVLPPEALSGISADINVSGSKISGIKAASDAEGGFDFSTLFGPADIGKTAYIFIKIHADMDCPVQFGFGADWWLQAWLNGTEIANTLKEGNLVWPPSSENLLTNAVLVKGENVLAVRCISGSGGWRLALKCAKRYTTGPYIDFVEDTISKLFRYQSEYIGKNLYGNSQRCITVTTRTDKEYYAITDLSGKSFRVYHYPAKEPDGHPVCMDFAIWPVLEKLRNITGDNYYGELVNGMAESFAVYGFDPRSGLAYWGCETGFDVTSMGQVSGGRYKQSEPMPRDVMWRYAPDKMSRLSKSIYYGLVTDPMNMDFNRYCYYGFDDRLKKPSIPWQAGHCAFASAGSMLIEGWIDAYCRTGDEECLEWSRQMTAKWAAVQDSNTGLIPHLFGSNSPKQKTMAAQPYCGNEFGSALSYLRAACQLAQKEPESVLAKQLRDMGLKLSKGLSKYLYDSDRKVFRSWLNTSDGTEQKDFTRYVFPSNEVKDHWVKIDPQLEKIPVYSGTGFYGGGPWSDCTQGGVPLEIAHAAEITGDPYLKERAIYFVEQIMSAAKELDGPFNRDGQWTYPETSAHIQLMLILHRLTNDTKYFGYAKELADMEITHLAQQKSKFQWWQFPYRSGLLNVLLDLIEAEKKLNCNE